MTSCKMESLTEKGWLLLKDQPEPALPSVRITASIVCKSTGRWNFITGKVNLPGSLLELLAVCLNTTTNNNKMITTLHPSPSMTRNLPPFWLGGMKEVYEIKSKTKLIYSYDSCPCLHVQCMDLAFSRHYEKNDV